jgi:hypothetical protein
MGNKYTDALKEAAKNRRDVEKKVQIKVWSWESGNISQELEVWSLVYFLNPDSSLPTSDS